MTADPDADAMAERLFLRFTFFERILHWVVGVTFVLLLATGLAFAYPALFWLTALLGGGPSARVLHPWIGMLFTAGMAAMIVVWFRDMFLSDSDRRWLRAVRAYATRDSANVPPAGKYNAGQKMFFWVQGALAVVFVASGSPSGSPPRSARASCSGCASPTTSPPSAAASSSSSTSTSAPSPTPAPPAP